jgi:homoaconitate hydratase
MVVASDSHSNMYGGLGCLGTPIVRTDAAAIWATGRTWWQVPQITKVNFINKLRPGSSGKDVIIALCGYFNKDQVLNHALEFTGPGLGFLSVDDRLTIANMTTEWGALAGVFPVDEITLDYLWKRAQRLRNHSRFSKANIDSLAKDVIQPDSNASYFQEIEFDLSSVSPFVSGPNSVKRFMRVEDVEEMRI